MSSFFGSSSKITPREFDDVSSSLLSHGFSHHEIARIRDMADGSLFENGRHRGLDRNEAERLIDTLRRNKSSHSLSDHQIDVVSEVLTKHF